jgi:hypothetical protein
MKLKMVETARFFIDTNLTPTRWGDKVDELKGNGTIRKT